MTTLNDTLNVAVEHHRSGQWEQAERLYRDIVRIDANHANALHLLGVLYCQRGDPQAGVQYLQRAISSDSSAALFHMHLGVAFRALGNIDDAIQGFRRAVELERDYGDAHFQLGVCYERRANLGEAIQQFRAAADSQPENSEFCFRLGSALDASGQSHEAAQFLRKAVELRPNDANYHNSLGSALQKLGKLVEATHEYDEAVRLKPSFGPFHFNLGNILREQDQLEQAIQHYEAAVRLAPDDREARMNLGVALKEIGRLNDALACYDRLLCDDAGFTVAHFNRSLVLLQQGDFARGWDEYEWRWEGGACPRPFAQPCWDGSPLSDNSIFIHTEQGIGDQIMFGSCLPDILKQTSRCVVECDRRLVPLFARSFPAAHVVGKGIDTELAVEADVQIPFGGLPRFLRRSLQEFPARSNYLVPAIDRVAVWRERFDSLGAGLKVGISWRGGKDADVRRKRSTTLDQWVPVLTLPSVHFVNLQYGECAAELKIVFKRHQVKIHHWDDSDPLADLDGLAAQIAALDLVISVDNATVHLAGALGRPVWALLPFAADWRWMRDRDDTPWYPSVRLFRQSVPGDWDSIFRMVRETLTVRLEGFHMESAVHTS